MTTPTTEIYTLSLHDALPISAARRGTSRSTLGADRRREPYPTPRAARALHGDRKSTRLNSSHSQISYAVFWLKKKTSLLRCGWIQAGSRSLFGRLIDQSR